MQKTFILIIILFTISIFFCIKTQKTENDNSKQIIDMAENRKTRPSFDFTEIQNKLKKTRRLDLESFVLVTILHKQFITNLQQENKETARDQAFYQKKNMEFFSQFLFSQTEYNNFLKDNRDALNSYIQNHPEFLDIIGTL